jgi:formylglycine-generating enzyme required for sulfatase activity
MKSISALSFLLFFTGSLFAQSAAVDPVVTDPAARNLAVSTNKPDLKQLMKSGAFTNSIGMVLVKIGPSLWAGRYLVTQTDYLTVMGTNPSKFKSDRHPVDTVSWNDAVRFCTLLTDLEKREEFLPTGYLYSLPTQAQWEQMLAGAPLAQAVTSEKANRTGTAAVGSLAPNQLGLYDIRGNLWQWCLDPQDKPFRVLRGGAWNTSIEINLRPEFRWYSTGPDDRRDIYGFRCVLRSAN